MISKTHIAYPGTATLHAARTAATLALALASPWVTWAAGPTLLSPVPFVGRAVTEHRLSDDSLIQEATSFTSSTIDEGDSAQIELGPGGPRHVAQAYSTFNDATQTSTYWVSVNDYPGFTGSTPGSFFDNGRSTALVLQTWHFRKDADDATLALHVTGGRLRLLDFSTREVQVAETGLDWEVSTASVNVSSGDYYALLTGHGGVLGGSETFNFFSHGFQLNPDSYTENTRSPGSLNVVEAILDIPAQDIEIDISSIIPFNEFTSSDGEFTLTVAMRANALALNPELGGTAQAFLRDPFSIDQADPLLGGNGLSFTGITVLAPAPVPEPENWALFLAGCSLIGWIARRRARLAEGTQFGCPFRAEEEKTA